MKIRSLSLVIALAAVASGAVAGEAIHTAASGHPAVNPAHQALGIGDTARFADVMPMRGVRTATQMPACNTCH